MANNAPPSPVTLLLTRPADAAERFLAGMPGGLRDRLEPVFSPLLRIDRIPAELDPDPGIAAIFTSPNGVRHGPGGAGRDAFCVGRATTRAASGRGWSARLAGRDAGALVAFLRSRRHDGRLVHLRGRHTRGDVAARLRASGRAVEEVMVYDQVVLALNQAARGALARGDATVVPLFSPRTAAQFAREARGAAGARVVALSAAVARAARPVPVREVAERPDAAGMYRAIRRALPRAAGRGAASRREAGPGEEFVGQS